jgi:histidinol-phosphatase
MSDYHDELAFAREVAVAGGDIAMGYYRGDLASRRKPDGTWVTEADHAVEADVRARIAAAFPEHNILGEEEGLAGSEGGSPRPGAPTWVVDPIDGTHNYMAGIPIWALLVALRVDDRSVVGVCHAPALGETYEAAVGGPAMRNDETMTVDPLNELARATVVSSGLENFVEAGLEDFYRQLARRCWRTRGFGDFWGHMLVAQGAAHAMVEPVLSIWDYAPLEVILEAAGGRITQIDGSPLADGGSCLTTNGQLHSQIALA